MPAKTSPRRSELQQQHDRFIAIMSTFPEILYVTDPQTYEVIWVNQVFADALGEDPTGKLCHQAFQGLDAPCPFCTNEIILETRKPHVWEHHNELLDRHFLITDQLVQWPDGREVRFEHAVDITERKQAELELARHKTQLEELVAARTDELTRAQEALSRQAQEILDLSTPVLQVRPGIVAAPLIGSLDSRRTQQFMERLLTEVVETRSEVAIVDITGVPAVDTQTAQHLTEATQAVRLLGARLVLTGIRPAIAQTLVHLGVDLSEVVTRASLSEGVKVALGLVGLAVGRREETIGKGRTR